MEAAMNNQINNLTTQNDKFIDMESFTHKLKREDEYNLRVSKTFLWIFIGFICLYLMTMVKDIITDKGLYRMFSQIFFILSFIAYIIIYRKNIKRFKEIDYSLPIAEMLKGVVMRYQIKVKLFLVLLIPIFLMDGGLTLTFYEDLGSMSPLNKILIIQAFYIPIMAISALIGILIWRNKQKPLRDKALELLKELES